MGWRLARCGNPHSRCSGPAAAAGGAEAVKSSRNGSYANTRSGNRCPTNDEVARGTETGDGAGALSGCAAAGREALNSASRSAFVVRIMARVLLQLQPLEMNLGKTNHSLEWDLPCRLICLSQFIYVHRLRQMPPKWQVRPSMRPPVWPPSELIIPAPNLTRFNYHVSGVSQILSALL